MNLKEVKLTRIAAMMLIGCVLGFALLAAVYCLPLDTLRDAEGTAAIFREEGNRPAAIPGYPGSTGDGYTDALMITEALFHDPQVSPLEQAVYVNRRAHSDSASADLVRLIEGGEMQWTIQYTRYWHGFLVFLRPLLMVFSYADLRMLMCAAQVLMIVATALSLDRKKHPELMIPFLAACMTLSPMGTTLSLQYFSAYAIMMLGLLGVLWLDEKLVCGANYLYFFMLLGMLTCYFDFLTFPIVTVCMPLALALYLHRDDAKLLRFAFSAGAAWCVGYLGFWAMKWVAGSLLVGKDLVYNAYHHAAYQMSTADTVQGSRFEAITRNVAAVMKPGYAAVYLAALVCCILPMIRGRRDVRSLAQGGRWLLVLLSLAPFVWWLMAASHSMVHAIFTHRLLAITVFALLSFLVSAKENRI